MYTLLSPAKKLDLAPNSTGLNTTLPDLMAESSQLAGTLRALSAVQLGNLMKLSENLAALNHERYQAWAPPFTLDNAKAAALMFAGDTYIGLDAPSLSDDDLHWSQNHLGILSGLYGLLRPLDLIQPYRLEMGTKLGTARGKNLYAFWGQSLSQTINARTTAHADRTIINLASLEYFKAIKPKALKGIVITPTFKEVKKGQSKVIGFMAKKARGMMARHIVLNRIESPEDLKAFTGGGYAYQPASSTELNWVFTRPSTTA
jgi:cytoplasmic iron level regulating protein YaaA (DUF328/UPF0246 family)